MEQAQRCLQSLKLYLMQMASALSLWKEHVPGKHTLWGAGPAAI